MSVPTDTFCGKIRVILLVLQQKLLTIIMKTLSVNQPVRKVNILIPNLLKSVKIAINRAVNAITIKIVRNAYRVILK
jgi:hypothetical protein